VPFSPGRSVDATSHRWQPDSGKGLAHFGKSERFRFAVIPAKPPEDSHIVGKTLFEIDTEARE